MKSWTRRLAGACLLGVFLPIASVGCFGRFELTRKIYRFNQNVDQDKWIRWLVFLCLNIIPIYSLGTLIDVLFANSVEFWSGKNPITADAGRRVIHGPGGEVATFTARPDGRLDVEVTKQGRMLSDFTVAREAGGLSAWDAEGRLLARVMDVNGEPMIVAGALAR